MSQQFKLPNHDRAEWKIICDFLSSEGPYGSRSILSIDDHIALVKELDNLIVSSNSEKEPTTEGLHFHNLSFLFKKNVVNAPVNEKEFISVILPKIRDWTLELDDLFPTGLIPVLSIGSAGSWKITRRMARCLLSSAFFCLLRDQKIKQSNYLDFGMFLSVACNTFLTSLVNYFVRMVHMDTSRNLDEEYFTIERKALIDDYESNFDSKLDGDALLCPINFVEGKIQDNRNYLMVDFANCMIGGHVITGAVAQEGRFQVELISTTL